MNFKIGDVVQLKSGGPRMAISEISENRSAHCQWFDKAKLSSANFAIDILEPSPGDNSLTLEVRHIGGKSGLAEAISQARKRVEQT